MVDPNTAEERLAAKLVIPFHVEGEFQHEWNWGLSLRDLYVAVALHAAVSKHGVYDTQAYKIVELVDGVITEMAK
jgi:hypothetical protein